jgi:hypothetical protein
MADGAAVGAGWRAMCIVMGDGKSETLGDDNGSVWCVAQGEEVVENACAELSNDPRHALGAQGKWRWMDDARHFPHPRDVH